MRGCFEVIRIRDSLPSRRIKNDEEADTEAEEDDPAQDCNPFDSLHNSGIAINAFVECPDGTHDGESHLRQKDHDLEVEEDGEAFVRGGIGDGAPGAHGDNDDVQNHVHRQDDQHGNVVQLQEVPGIAHKTVIVNG